MNANCFSRQGKGAKSVPKLPKIFETTKFWFFEFSSFRVVELSRVFKFSSFRVVGIQGRGERS